jgi:tetratricopeptide (TPR) repeat protein
MRKFVQLSKSAKVDIEAAQKLNPNDPEVYAALADVVAPIEDMAEIRRYYDQTLALNPHHVGVRYTMMTFLQPQWHGSWKELEAYVKVVDNVQPPFPFLFTVRRDGYSLLEEPDNDYEDLWGADETYRQAAAAFKAQLEQNPTELTLMASAAYFAARSGDLAAAVGFFEQIGNQYPVVDEFPNLFSYHWWRMHTMVEYSDEPGIIGTPREKELLDAVRALEPDHWNANAFYVAYLLRTRDDEQTRAYWNSLDGGYYGTGVLGNPPNYDILQAMSIALRSQSNGVAGTDQEVALLQEALALAPENAMIRLVYAEHIVTAKRYDEARIQLERARELDPAYLPALLTMGWLNYHQKRWDDGIATANQFLASGDSRYVKMNTNDAKEIIELCEKKKKKAAAQGNDSNE